MFSVFLARALWLYATYNHVVEKVKRLKGLAIPEETTAKDPAQAEASSPSTEPRAAAQLHSRYDEGGGNARDSASVVRDVANASAQRSRHREEQIREVVERMRRTRRQRSPFSRRSPPVGEEDSDSEDSSGEYDPDNFEFDTAGNLLDRNAPMTTKLKRNYHSVKQKMEGTIITKKSSLQHSLKQLFRWETVRHRKFLAAFLTVLGILHILQWTFAISLSDKVISSNYRECVTPDGSDEVILFVILFYASKFIHHKRRRPHSNQLSTIIRV